MRPRIRGGIIVIRNRVRGVRFNVRTKLPAIWGIFRHGIFDAISNPSICGPPRITQRSDCGLSLGGIKSGARRRDAVKEYMRRLAFNEMSSAVGIVLIPNASSVRSPPNGISAGWGLAVVR